MSLSKDGLFAHFDCGSDCDAVRNNKEAATTERVLASLREELEATKISATTARQTADIAATGLAIAKKNYGEAQARVNRYDEHTSRIVHAITALSSLTDSDTLKVEGPKKYKLLGGAKVPSASTTKHYTIEVRLYGQRIVLACSCPRFQFTRGSLEDGNKTFCKHIETFRRNYTEAIKEAYDRALAVTSEPIFNFFPAGGSVGEVGERTDLSPARRV